MEFLAASHELVFLDFQRGCAAFLVISARFLGERHLALAFPPFSPPKRPRATAAGFFSGSFFFLVGFVPLRDESAGFS